MKAKRLLSNLRRQIRALFLLHGISIFIAYACLLLVVVYVGDRLLEYPQGIRVFQIFMFGGMTLYVLHRFVLGSRFNFAYVNFTPEVALTKGLQAFNVTLGLDF